MRKRQRLVLVSFLMTIGLWWVQQTGLEWRYLLICILGLVNWVLAGWALREGLSGIEWLMIPLPIATFTIAVGFFYILLPAHWLALSAVLLLYAIGQYAWLLTGNIFSVASIRTIALFRAAQAVSLIMTLLAGFFLFDTILSLRMGFVVVSGLTCLASLILTLPYLWSVELGTKITLKILIYSFFQSLFLGFLSGGITIWPTPLTVASVFLCSILYVYLGIAQHHFSDRLFKNTIWEYVTVGGVALLVLLGTTIFSQG